MQLALDHKLVLVLSCALLGRRESWAEHAAQPRTRKPRSGTVPASARVLSARARARFHRTSEAERSILSAQSACR